MPAPIQSVFANALSKHQFLAMEQEIREDKQEGFVLDVMNVHGNAVRGLARHGLALMTASTYARLTPMGVRLYAALNDLDEEETLRRHAAHFKSSSDLALFSAGL